MTDEIRSGQDGGRDPDLDVTDAYVDRVLEGRAGARETHDPSALAATLHRVRSLADEPLPVASRDRHLLRIRTHGPTGDPTPGRPRRVRRRLVALGAATALLVVSGGGAVAAAQDAQPDDALYGLKRTSEQVWLAVPRASGRAAQVHLALAERRITEARQAPAHAARLVAEGLENVEEAAEERPEEAIANFERLLGDGADRLPDNASPVARAALHRNCVRIAGKHGLSADGCGPAPDVAHPGRGHGAGQGAGKGVGRGADRADAPGPGKGRGQGGEARDRMPGDGEAQDRPRGWGPGGRPDGAVGPPPGTPGHGRGGQRAEAPGDTDSDTDAASDEDGDAEG